MAKNRSNNDRTAQFWVKELNRLQTRGGLADEQEGAMSS